MAVLPPATGVKETLDPSSFHASKFHFDPSRVAGVSTVTYAVSLLAMPSQFRTGTKLMSFIMGV